MALPAIIVATSHGNHCFRRCRVKTIATMITVLPDGSVQVPSQPGLAPGAYRAMLVVSEPVPRPLLPLPLQLKL